MSGREDAWVFLAGMTRGDGCCFVVVDKEHLNVFLWIVVKLCKVA